MKCPKCEKELEKKNFCKFCKISICPHCNNSQISNKQLSLPLALIGGLLFPFLLVFMAILPGAIELGYFFSSEKCHACGKRIIT